MSVKFSGKRNFPLEYNVNDNEIAVLFDSYAINEAFNVVAGDPEKWMSGQHWDQLTTKFSRYLETTCSNGVCPPRMRISSDDLKSIIQDN